MTKWQLHPPEYGKRFPKYQSKTIILRIYMAVSTKLTGFLTKEEYLSSSLPEIWYILPMISSSVFKQCPRYVAMNQQQVEQGLTNSELPLNNYQQLATTRQASKPVQPRCTSRYSSLGIMSIGNAEPLSPIHLLSRGTSTYKRHTDKTVWSATNSPVPPPASVVPRHTATEVRATPRKQAWIAAGI